MKKCGKLYDEILKSKSVASRKLDYNYMKTLDVIRRSNLSERRRWVRKVRHDYKSNIQEFADVPPSETQCNKSQKKQDKRSSTNKIKAEIQRKSLQHHMKKQKDVSKEGK